MSRPREFHFSDEDFDAIRVRIKVLAGIELADHKREMVYSRLARRLRHYGFDSFQKYLILLSDDENELITFVNSLTTNLTSFFREKHHFEYLKETIFPELINLHQGDKKIRIWISASSTGEEAYSTAITFCETVPDWKSWDFKILSTDLDTAVVKSSKTGIYHINRIEDISEEIRQKYFLRGKGDNQDKCRLRKEIVEMVHFDEFNLIKQPWALSTTFDVVFCRNVLIYFDRPTQQIVLTSLMEHLKTEGHLFLGHSESIGELKSSVEHLGRTWFRKVSISPSLAMSRG